MELPAFSYPEEIGDRTLLNREIEEYLRGERTCFSETLCEQVRQGIARVGTPFQQRVWTEMMHIPYGSTVSYSELARRIGQPKATRAVGNACHRNPFLLVVPCHRVVAARSLGGFALGIPTKQRLLHHEATNKNKKIGSLVITDQGTPFQAVSELSYLTSCTSRTGNPR